MTHQYATSGTSSMPAPGPGGLAEHSGRLLGRLRARTPLVQCLTSTVVSHLTAASLLALGASPVMCDICGEAGVLARDADAVLVNLGTPSPEQRAAALEAVEGAHDAGTAWVLDPVGCGAMPVRTAFARRLRDMGPSVVRGNASEVLALAGAGGGARGVDAVDTVEDAADAARDLALATGGVVAVSGPVDLVTDGSRSVRLANGDPLLARVTGSGCTLGAVMAAFVSLEDDHLVAAVAATASYSIAGEIVGEVAGEAAAGAAGREHGAGRVGGAGPGSFAVALVDVLASLSPQDVAARARLS